MVVYTFGHGLQIWQIRKIKYLIVSTKDVRFFLLCLLSFLQDAEIIMDEIIMKLAEVWGFEFDNTDTFGVILECDIGGHWVYIFGYYGNVDCGQPVREVPIMCSPNIMHAEFPTEVFLAALVDLDWNLHDGLHFLGVFEFRLLMVLMRRQFPIFQMPAVEL